MKLKKKLLGIAAIIAVIGFLALTLTGCGGGDNGGGNTYAVTVNGGSGSGSYAAGTTVSISATVPSGQTFVNWTVNSGGAFLVNANSASTTFTMPANAVTVTANFSGGGGNTYAVTVNGGSGSGNYAVGVTVSISATAPSGQTFVNWTVNSGGANLASANRANTTFTMPANAVIVTANFSGDSVNIEMVTIPGGTFIMGSPESEPQISDDETQHSVTITGFSMSKYEVTQAQWVAVMGTGEDRTKTSEGKGDNYPVNYVSWYDAIVFCNKLSIKEGKNPVYSIGGSTDPAVWIANNSGSIPTSSNSTWDAAVMDKSKNGYRLPTEAEWEYACRGSYTNKATETNTKPFGIGDGTKILYSMANFNCRYAYDLAHLGEYDTGRPYLGKTTAVGSYAANNYGLYDMHGNLREWCWDRYGSYASGAQTDPTGEVVGTYRMTRGGGWISDGRKLRSASRSYDDPGNRGNYYSDSGIRLVRP